MPLVSQNHFEVLGALGVSKLNAGNSSLGVTSSETDELVQSNSGSWDAFSAQLGLGYIAYLFGAQQYSENVQWFPWVEPELNGYYIGTNSIKGDVWRFQSSAWNQMTYDIPVHSTRLMLDAALTVASYKKASIYGLVGIGDEWTNIGYSDTNDGPGAPCVNQRLHLNNRTNSKFAWETGAGVLYSFNDRVGLSLEYLYANLGNVKTSASGNTGTITAPVIVPAHFSLSAQSALLGLHVAL